MNQSRIYLHESFALRGVCGRAKLSDIKILVESLSLIVRMLRPYSNIQNRWALPTLQFGSGINPV
jgi:hypothetical protein